MDIHSLVVLGLVLDFFYSNWPDHTVRSRTRARKGKKEKSYLGQLTPQYYVANVPTNTVAFAHGGPPQAQLILFYSG